MDKYFYLVSQLPALRFDETPPISIDAFLNEAEKWLSSGDLVKLKGVDLESSSRLKQNVIGRQCLDLEEKLREETGRYRQSVREGREFKPLLVPVNLLKEGTPLDVEKNLMRLEWRFFEDLESEHHFDLGFLILYYLKLQILQRLASFDSDAGLETYQQICKVTV